MGNHYHKIFLFAAHQDFILMELMDVSFVMEEYLKRILIKFAAPLEKSLINKKTNVKNAQELQTKKV